MLAAAACTTLRQPLDPFFMRQGIHVVMPRNVFDLDPNARTELIGTSHNLLNPTVITLRAPQPQEQQGPRHGAFLFFALRIAPQVMSRMRHAPPDLGSLIRELSSRGIELANELIARMTAWIAEGGNTEARFGSRLGILLQMPIVGPDGVTTGATDNVAFLTAATVGDIGIALGRVGRSPANMKGGPRYTRLLSPAGVNETALAAMPLLMGVAHVEFDQLRASELSGKTAPPPRQIVQVGAGTIGSLAAENLVSEGFGLHWTFIDPDYLLPHNLARHNLVVIDVGMPKALGLAERINALRADVRARRNRCRRTQSGGAAAKTIADGPGVCGFDYRRRRLRAGRPLLIRSARRDAAGQRVLQPGRHSRRLARGKPRSNRQSADA